MRSLLVLLLLSGTDAAEAGAPPAGSLQQAVRLFQAHEFEPAEELLLAIRESRPESAEAAFYLGRAYLEQGKAKAAVDELERATRLDPSSSAYQFWLAEALVARIDEAAFFFKVGIAKRMRAAYEKAVELDPENLEARVAVARFHAEAPGMAGGSAERAAAELEEIERRDRALAHVARALIHERLGRAEAVEGELRAAVEADPGTVVGWRELGLFYQRQERWEEAQKAFAEVLACTPDDPVALYESARSAVAIAERQLRSAEGALLAYLQLEPGPEPMVLEGEPPRRAAAYEELGRVYERQGWPGLNAPGLLRQWVRAPAPELPAPPLLSPPPEGPPPG